MNLKWMITINIQQKKENNKVILMHRNNRFKLKNLSVITLISILKLKNKKQNYKPIFKNKIKKSYNKIQKKSSTPDKIKRSLLYLIFIII